MASESELREWTQPGAQDAAQRTYASIKAALEASSEVKGYNAEIFLQGSYANHTNTRGDSDVDIVVKMRSAYMPDISRLSPLERVMYKSSQVSATTTVEGLRSAVITALKSYYGASRVQGRNKCIRVDKRDGYVDADVVPAQEHRLYTRFPSSAGAAYIEGISIKPLTGQRIVNYPKQHTKNGEAKNGLCSELYKPTVRQIKRLRRRAVDAGLLGPKDAPGYLLECLTFNVPQNNFVTNDKRRVWNALLWLQGLSTSQLRSQIKSADGVHWLFKDDPGKHDADLAHHVLKTLWTYV